jgi:hypothetical protein
MSRNVTTDSDLRSRANIRLARAPLSQSCQYLRLRSVESWDDRGVMNRDNVLEFVHPEENNEIPLGITGIPAGNQIGDFPITSLERVLLAVDCCT